MSTFNLQFSIFLVLPVVIFGLLAVAIWLIERKKLTRAWLPILKIISIERRLLPKIQVTPPPWVSFLLFLLIALILLFVSLRPYHYQSSTEKVDRLKSHILVDLSPSVSGVIEREQLIEAVKGIIDEQLKVSKLSIGFTGNNTIFDLPGEDMQRLLDLQIRFHRSGAKIGSALQQQVAGIGDLDQIIIVSDRDEHSWNTFSDGALQTLQVAFVDLTKTSELSASDNLFIDDVRVNNVQDNTSLIFDVKILRSRIDGKIEDSTDPVVQGELIAESGVTLLKRESFSFETGQSSINVRVELSRTHLSKFLESQQKDLKIAWKLELSAKDALEMDNLFYQTVKPNSGKILTLGGFMGERFLLDPTHDLTVSLETLGYAVGRLDTLGDDTGDFSEYPHVILIGGDSTEAADFCIDKQIAESQDSSSSVRQPAKMWIVPASLTPDYNALCNCLSRLISSGSEVNQENYCKGAIDRNSWSQLLSALGGKQVGGEVGNTSEAIAYRMKSRFANTDLLLFTIPLYPNRMLGLTHGNLTFLLRELLKLEGLYENIGWGSIGEVARIDDISEYLKDRPKNETNRDLEQESENELENKIDKDVKFNVPRGESSLTIINSDKLPKQFTATRVKEISAALATGRPKQNSEFWLRWAMYFLLGLLLMEGIYLVFQARFSKSTNARVQKYTGVIFVFLVSFSTTSELRADVELAFAGDYGFVKSPKFRRGIDQLVKNVMGRTSIELSSIPKTYYGDNKPNSMYQSPWLIVNRLNQVTENDGQLNSKIRLWLKRGGFLIVEGYPSSDQLGRLTSDLTLFSRDKGKWSAVPPDHELMRSFYLLDSLPVCGAKPWTGFHFDGRLAILAIPYNFSEHLIGGQLKSDCEGSLTRESSLRLFINILMVALATDYKKDQVHLPEILKRLR